MMRAHRSTDDSLMHSNKECNKIHMGRCSHMTDLLRGENRRTDKVSESIFDHVLHQVGPKHLLIVYQECCLELQREFI